MTMTFLVTSKVVPMPPVPIQGTGDNTFTARQAAIHTARTIKKIPAPIVLDSREGALALRRWAEEHRRSLVNAGQLNGRSSFVTAPESPAARFYRN